MALREYEPGRAFPGVIGRTAEESSPAWPHPLRAAAGAPNVLFIVLEHTGFAQLGCYGSPIATAHIDSLAAGGSRYTNMHTTALCSPSRAASRLSAPSAIPPPALSFSEPSPLFAKERKG
jgi:Sulfatase